MVGDVGPRYAAGERGLSEGSLLARFKTNGKPDRRFGRGGVRIQPFNGMPNRPRSFFGLDFDSRRRIVAAGTAFDVVAARGNKVVAAGEANGDRVGVVRLNAVGQPDNSFGPGGIRSFHVPGSTLDEADAVLPLGNGPLLVGGLSGPGGFVVKLGDGGLPAAGFGTAGFSVHDFGDDSGPSGQVYDMALAGHGKILLTGDASAGASSATGAGTEKARPVAERKVPCP